ncbi:MAG: hypothetical protein ACOYD0_04890 [Candidatus Nanopelagicales bacterium]
MRLTPNAGAQHLVLALTGVGISASFSGVGAGALGRARPSNAAR